MVFRISRLGRGHSRQSGFWRIKGEYTRLYRSGRDELGKPQDFSRLRRDHKPRILLWIGLRRRHKLLVNVLSLVSSANAASSRTGMHTEVTLSTLEHLAHRPGLLAREASNLYRCRSGACYRRRRRLNGRRSLYQVRFTIHYTASTRRK